MAESHDALKNSGLIIVTGLSGAGMSSVLKALEDIRFEVLDNFPLGLIPALLEKKSDRPIAIGVDSRTRNFSPAKLKKAMKEYDARLIFITCDENVLQKRFTETRRKHPMAKDRPVSDGIKKEMEFMAPLNKAADLAIDTSELSIHDLRRTVEGYFAASADQRLTVTLVSFGFKNGLPRDADIVMDVRFLKNPHWDKKLKPMTGQDKSVGKFIAGDKNYAPFMENFKTMMEPLLQRYTHEGKSYLTIAFGCTGGKHRSVFAVEELAKWLKKMDVKHHIKHRDMPV